jgi:hypothetical protein
VEGVETALGHHLHRLDAAGIGYRPPVIGGTAPTVRITTGK